jgi:hypothetical protein
MVELQFRINRRNETAPQLTSLCDGAIFILSQPLRQACDSGKILLGATMRIGDKRVPVLHAVTTSISASSSLQVDNRWIKHMPCIHVSQELKNSCEIRLNEAHSVSSLAFNSQRTSQLTTYGLGCTYFNASSSRWTQKPIRAYKAIQS